MSPWDFQNKVKELIMRKTIISALALLSLTACVQEEMVSVNQGDAIAFDNAFVEMVTRAESLTKDNLTGFNVWGYINNPNAAIFESTEVKNEENSGWTYDGTQYWIPGQYYYFAAIAPMSSQNWSVTTKDNNDVCLGNTYGPGLLKFKNVDGSEDLIYSATHVVAAESGQNRPVSFNFKHILSKVKFTFANHMGNDYIDVKVSNITLKAPKEATMNLASESLVWTPGSEKESYNFGSLEIAAKDNGSSEDLFVIPSTAAVPYEITFDMELVMDGVDGTKEVLYHATKNATIAGNALEIGTAYNFSAAINPDILNLDTIEFTVDDVEDWDDASDLSKIAIASKLGGEVTLTENVRIPDSDVIEVTRNLTINLNGKALSYNGDNRMFKVVDGATLTINGNDIETSSVVVESDNLNESTTAAYIATAYADSKIVINGGAHTTNGCTTYHANGGTVEINSGSFAATEEGYTPAEKYGHKYTLNIQGTEGEIVVNGGSFYKWDPSQSKGESPVANFVAEGYATIADGDWYKVTKGIVISVDDKPGKQIKDAIAAAQEQAQEGETVEVNIVLDTDITPEVSIDVKAGVEMNLNLNGKTITIDTDELAANGNGSHYAFMVREGGTLVIDGNGSVEATTPKPIFFYPAGNLVIESGTFIRHIPEGYTDSATSMFVGTKPSGGWNSTKVTINGGYFDSGYYNENAADIEKILAGTDVLEETDDDIKKRGQPGDINKVRVALKNNCSKAFNRSNNDFKVYGGTFVGANPAWGDEGCMLPTTPVYLRPWSYYQGAFLEGQTFNENGIVLPDGYTITKGVHEDGRPTYTVTYNK